MSLRSFYEFCVFAALFVWGAISLIHGAAISFFINGKDDPSSGLVVGLTYSGVMLAFVAGLLHARITAVVSIILSVGLIGVLVTSNGLAHGSEAASALIFAVISRSLLAGLLLMTTPSVGPVGRLLRRKR